MSSMRRLPKRHSVYRDRVADEAESSVQTTNDDESESERSFQGKDTLDPKTSVEELMRIVCKDKLGIDVDQRALVKVLKDEFIFTKDHVSRLTVADVNNLKLPLMIRVCLYEWAKREKAAAPMGGMAGSVARLRRQGTVSALGEDKSETETSASDKGISLSEAERQGIKNCWKVFLTKTKNFAPHDPSGFINDLWGTWTKMDNTAASMFKTRNTSERADHLRRIMKVLMDIAENPNTASLHVQNLSVQHTIWNIDHTSYTALAISFTGALEKLLGKDLAMDVKDAWYTLITGVGSLLMDSYAGVREGWTDTVMKRSGTTWKTVWTKMTHDSLLLYKSASFGKAREKLIFSLATDMGTVDEGMSDKPNNFCFYIQFGTLKRYFCATSAAKLAQWLQNIAWRLKSYERMIELDGSTVGGSKYFTDSERKKIQDQNKELSKKGGKRGKSLANYQKNRKALDDQIKTSAGFNLFDNLHHATIVIDADGIVQYVNKAACSFTGYDAVHLLGKNVSMLTRPQTAPHHDDYIRSYIATGKSAVMGKGRNVTLRHKSGAELGAHITVTEHRSTGQLLFIGTLSEETESTSEKSKEGDASSEESSSGNDFGIFDNLNSGVLVANEFGTIEYMNPAVERVSGYAASELKGKNVKLLCPPEHERKHDQYLKNYVTSGVAKVIGIGRDVELKTKWGQILPIHLEVTEHKKKGAGGRRFIGTLAAIETESLESLIEKQSSVLADLLVPVILISSDGIVRVFNKPAEKVFGYREKEVVGKNVNMLMPAEHSVNHDSYLENYIRTGKGKIIGKGREVYGKDKSGQEKKFHLTVTEKRNKVHRIFIGILSVK